MASKREDLEVVIGADLGGLAAELRRGAGLVKGFGRDVEQALPKAKDFAPRVDMSGLRGAAKDAQAAGLSFRGATMGLAGFAAKVAATGGTLVALELGFQGVSGALELVKDSVKMAADIEQTSIAFETMLGSAEKAKTVMADLRKFAAETPFSAKEVTQGARQLLAYGVAADQLIPTLKLVGTLAAGTSTPLGENIYRYGTTRVQGVAHQLDINQLTNAGIDVIPGIAKQLGIAESQVRKFTEEGRVDFNVYQAALIELGNTRFSGLLERQAKSLKGGWEQMTDAFDRAKLTLGQVIVEEIGLKGVTKDLELFGGQIERTIGGSAVRQGIRFLGDLGKAGAQVGYEFTRAGVSIASISLESIGRSFPGIQAAANSLSATLKDMQSFRIDRKQLAETVLNFTEMFVIGAAQTIDWAEKTGVAIERDLVDPLKKVVKHLAQIDALSNGCLTIVNQRFFEQLGINLAEPDKGAKVEPKGPEPQNQFQLPAADKDVLALYRQFKRDRDSSALMAADLQRPGADPAEKLKWERLAKETREDFDGFIKAFGAERSSFAEAALAHGFVPGRDAVAIPPVASGPKTREDIAREQFGMFRDELRGRISRDEHEHVTERLSGFKAEALNPLAGLAALGPYAHLAPAFDLARQGTLRPDSRTPAHVVDLATRLNDEFDPLPKLLRTKADMERALKDGLVTQSVFDQGWHKEVKGVADRLGVGGVTRLPDAALVGSQEDARLLAHFFAGQQKTTTEDLLRQLVELNQRLVNNTSPANRAPMPRAVGIAVPGGG